LAHRLEQATQPEIAMNPSPSPRHPWKALAVVLAMFAVVHGARATVGPHEHGFTHIRINDVVADRDCPDVDVEDADDNDDDEDVPALVDHVGDGDWN
jgi:hypothetical protein